MLDLSSTLFFKGAFDFRSLREDEDLLWALVMKIRNWMVPKWQRNDEPIPDQLSVWSGWKLGRNFSSENELVHFRSVYHKGEEDIEAWACQIIESETPESGFAPREWTTEIGFQLREAGQAQVSIVIYYSDRPGFIGECLPTPRPTLPGLLRLFVRDKNLVCTVDDQPMTLRPLHLEPGSFPSFWKLVSCAAREVPVIYISPGTREDETTGPLLDPKKLALLLGPNALVFYADDPEFSQEMQLMCSQRNFGCYNGQVRVYASHPRMDKPEDSFRHRIIGVSDLRSDPEAVLVMLRRALAQDVHFYDRMFRMENCRALNERSRMNQRQRDYRARLENELLESAVEKEQQLQQQLENIDAERFSWELQKEELKDTISDLTDALHRAEALADNYRDEARRSAERQHALDNVRSVSSYPETPRQIVDYFLLHFADRLAFTRRGLASLDSCTTAPDVLWDALYQMVTTLYDLYDREDPQVDRTFNQLSRLRLARSEGTMTRRDAGLMRNYQDTYNGRAIDIQANIKTTESRPGSSKFLRIYFSYEPDLRKIVVGSCGEHLENYSSQKVH